MIFKAHSYQQFAINHIMNHAASALFLNMGMGKTVSALTAITDLIYLGEVTKVLVIAPLRVAQSTWSEECDKWDHLKGLRISKILGSAKERIEGASTEADIYIINRENTKWLVEHFMNKWPFDMLVIDELSSFKSASANRFRALRKVIPFFKKIVGLTGTPAPNSLIDLWPQLYLLDKGLRLGKTMTSYKQQYFNPGRRSGYIVYDWKLKDGSAVAIHKKIGDICISMKSEDYLKMPGRIDNIINVKLPDKIKDAYKKLEKELILDDDITAANAAVLTNKLLQICNGAIYDDMHNVVEMHDEKLKALEDVIEAANGKPVLIFYSYKHDLSRIQKYIKGSKKLEGPEDIKNWNEGKISVLLAHPASAGHGLNLQQGGSIIIWFGLTWSLENYLQANARLHRQGQKETVIVHHIIAKNTVDGDVLKALQRKEINQDALLEAVKARIKGGKI